MQLKHFLTQYTPNHIHTNSAAHYNHYVMHYHVVLLPKTTLSNVIIIMLKNKPISVTEINARVGTTKCHLIKMAIQHIAHSKP